MTPFEKMLENYRLTTAEIFYHMPDHPALIQSYIWQEYDLTPDFPELKKFLQFWETHLDGKMHSVVLTHVGMIKPSDWKTTQGNFYIN